MSVLLCLCTCPDADSASTIAATLVEERLAACVNQLPGLRSVYRWHGAVEHAEEVLLLIKTSGDRLEALTARLQTLHPYELPEVIAVEAAGGLAPYLAWVAEQTREDDRPA
jgi:periplasmic divalent cation tolerance protein